MNSKHRRTMTPHTPVGQASRSHNCLSAVTESDLLSGGVKPTNENPSIARILYIICYILSHMSYVICYILYVIHYKLYIIYDICYIKCYM